MFYNLNSISGIVAYRHLIGRTGLENLRAVAGVPHKAAAFLEQFTAAAYTSGKNFIY